jgi:hypothetical protein
MVEERPEAEEPRIVGRTRHGELTLDQIAAIQPGLGRLMPEVSNHYWIMFYAARGGNWALARYCLGQVRALFRIGMVTRPRMRPHLEAFDRDYLGPIEAAIRDQDLAAFEAAYRRGIEGANATHAAVGHPEIIWQLPPDPPKHLYLGPLPPPANP